MATIQLQTHNKRVSFIRFGARSQTKIFFFSPKKPFLVEKFWEIHRIVESIRFRSFDFRRKEKYNIYRAHWTLKIILLIARIITVWPVRFFREGGYWLRDRISKSNVESFPLSDGKKEYHRSRFSFSLSEIFFCKTRLTSKKPGRRLNLLLPNDYCKDSLFGYRQRMCWQFVKKKKS